jgi:hypothetical protein
MTCAEIDQLLELGPPNAYLQQTARAHRALARYLAIRTIKRGSLAVPSYYEIEDALWTFVQNCWHIKDWLASDPSVDRASRKHVVDAAEAHPLLQVVADLARGSKHFGHDRNRGSHAAQDGGMECIDNPDGTLTIEYMIEFRIDAHSRELRASEMGEEAMEVWERLFEEAGLRRLSNAGAT